MTTTARAQLCHSCTARPLATGDHPVLELARLRPLAHDPNPAVAHIAAVAIAVAREVEEWKRMAAAEPDPARAENFRKAAAVAKGTADQLAIVAQDAKAVTVS